MRTRPRHPAAPTLDVTGASPPATREDSSGRGSRIGTLLRRSAVVAAGAILVAITGTVAANAYVVARGGAYVVPSVDQAPSAQVAIVLGASVGADGRPSPMLADRLQTGIELYESGKVRKLLLSGDHGTVPYDEVNAMRTYVMEHGVPPEDVFMDHAGFSTFETMYRARDVFVVEDALVVTQQFHLDRAVYTARALGLQVTGVPADLRPYRGLDRLRIREWFARCKAVLQLHVLGSEPRFLGPAIPITGDGRATVD